MEMTATQKAVWNLRQEGRTQQQIADELGISRWTVRGHLSRAEEKVELDPAIEEAMADFGLTTTPVEVWMKNKRFSAKVRPEQASIRQQIISAVKDLPPAMPIPAPAEVEAETMTVYPLFDAHLGMRAHAAVSGEEMNLELGAQRIVEAAASVMESAPNSERGVIINGGDFTHQTDDLNKTRKSGHGLDVDGRNGITVLKGVEVISSIIEMALRKHQLVEYYSVPGNHDPQNWETILFCLAERYRNNPRVKIDFRLTEFSVVEHGEVAIFIHHGDKRTPKDLAMFCSAEFPEVWGRTRYRLLLTGHLHHIKVDEFPGIYWMQMPALAPRDQHAAGGYKSHSLMFALGFDLTSECFRATRKL